jgi:hypothetical protein
MRAAQDHLVRTGKQRDGHLLARYRSTRGKE